MTRKHRRHALDRQEGDLCEAPVSHLLERYRRQCATGRLRIESWGRVGEISLDAGAIADARFGHLRDADAIEELCALRDGMFEFRGQCTAPSVASRRAAAPPTPPRAAATPPPVPPRSAPPAPPSWSPVATAHAAAAPAWQRALPATHGPMTPSLPGQSAHAHAGWQPHVPVQPAGMASWQPATAARTAPAATHWTTATAHVNPLAYGMRLPSAATSLGILCLTMLLSTIAIQL